MSNKSILNEQHYIVWDAVINDIDEDNIHHVINDFANGYASDFIDVSILIDHCYSFLNDDIVSLIIDNFSVDYESDLEMIVEHHVVSDSVITKYYSNDDLPAHSIYEHRPNLVDNEFANENIVLFVDDFDGSDFDVLKSDVNKRFKNVDDDEFIMKLLYKNNNL